jgi:hypothetical protein
MMPLDDADDEGEGFEEGEAEVAAEDANDGKKKGTSQKTAGYSNKVDRMLSNSWLSISQEPICGAKQKGHVYLRKVNQEFHERWRLAPFWIHI